ncbi:MAG TPA: heavy metal-binding domain-containing protein [Allosphingosinicella sp.]
MNMMKWTALAVVAAMAAAQPAVAKKARTYIVNNEAVGVPVFPHDITDRPYTVIGEVKAGVRKATVFSKAASQKKIYRELWERARKKGADAVINASYGDSKISAMSWGQTNARGTAIRFTTPPASN